LGFTLNEILELLKLRVNKNESCESVLKKTKKKLNEVEQKIRGLKSMKKVLKKMIHRCEESTLTSDCPILGSFESGREL
jgi:MerR family mercuric resistance operon transcriptional regulator